MSNRSSMEICSLASGSKANALVIKSGESLIMVDAGLSARQTTKRLKSAGYDPADITAVLFTHNHSDHYDGLRVLKKSYDFRLFANEGTATGIDQAFPKSSFEWEIFETSNPFQIGELSIEPFTVSHDAADPVGFLIDNGRSQICIATDLGQSSLLLQNKLSRCHCIVIESNHDPDMLTNSTRAWSLKSRIAGRSGHLSNLEAATLISHSVGKELHTLLLAHISEECNTPDLALQTMRKTLDQIKRSDVKVVALSQHEVSPVFPV